MRRPTHRTRVRASSAEPPSTRAWEAPLPQGRGRASGVPGVPAGTQGVCPGVPGSAPQLRPPPRLPTRRGGAAVGASPPREQESGGHRRKSQVAGIKAPGLKYKRKHRRGFHDLFIHQTEIKPLG